MSLAACSTFSIWRCPSSFFIIDAALPALFYRVVAKTPRDQFAQPRWASTAVLMAALPLPLHFIR